MIEKARELGLALAATPEFLRMADARKSVERDTALTALMADFREKRDEMVSLVQADEVDAARTVEASADLERLQQQLFENPLFEELTDAEQAFSALLDAVNREINSCIGLEQPVSGCGGDCAGCSGCAH